MRNDNLERSDLLVVIECVDGRRQVTAGGEPLRLLPDHDSPEEISRALLRFILDRPGVYTQPGLQRLTLDLRDDSVRGFDWETHLRCGILVVRVSAVRPRVQGLPFTVPIRIVAVDHEPGFLPDAVYRVFRFHDRTDVEKAVIVRECTLADFPPDGAPFGWPVAEVLDFGRLPFAGHPERQLSHSVTTPGTLGWLARIADRLRTRLVVFQAGAAAERERALHLASALVGRGGPAVLIRTDPASAADFYTHVIHDFPFDLAFRPDAGEILFVGGGREQLLRVSDIGLGLLALRDERRRASDERKRDAESRPVRQSSAPPPRDALGEELTSFAKEWEQWTFEFHEREGLLPMSRQIDRVRATLPATAATAAMEAAPRRGRKPKQKEAERSVNGALGSVADGRWMRLDPEHDRLAVGLTYELSVQIGERDTTLVTIGSVGFADEQIGWQPEQAGIWIELAVSGVGIALAGEAVQQLWVPRTGETSPVYFPFVVRQPGAVSLRYTLFYRGNVLQTFRLAALSGEPSAEDRVLLAEALAISVEQVKEGTYVSRLEYTGEPLSKAADAPPKTLALVVNRGSGLASVDVKGEEFFVSNTSKSLPKFVERARTALMDVASTVIPGVARERWPYAFGLPGDPNAGSADKLKASLERLALTGWQLFDQVFREPRKPLLDALEQAKEAEIRVAHILLENVIPWAAIYDRMYTPEVETIDGKAVTKDVCLAALPGTDGRLPFTTCGTSPQCVLNDPSKQVHEQTVVCPLHFWGFRHVIDVPPQQTSEGEPNGHAPRTIVKAGPSVNVAVGVNAVLDLAGPHLGELTKLAASLPAHATVFGKPKSNADELVTALKAKDLDVIYFYCHARGGTYDPSIDPPCLELQENDQKAARLLTSADFTYSTPWQHDPLVILNGCSTAGFSPDALSPFIEKFVVDRGASGVLGTEVPVQEPLAGEMALEFLRRFLAGHPAGAALLEVRRLLLSRRNPLGLVYTLYADSRLELTRNAT